MSLSSPQIDNCNVFGLFCFIGYRFLSGIRLSFSKHRAAHDDRKIGNVPENFFV